MVGRSAVRARTFFLPSLSPNPQPASKFLTTATRISPLGTHYSDELIRNSESERASLTKGLSIFKILPAAGEFGDIAVRKNHEILTSSTVKYKNRMAFSVRPMIQPSLDGVGVATFGRQARNSDRQSGRS
jgi:hypothetical protein